MKFSIGDLVSLKKTGEEGKITAQIDDEMYEVEINGTKFPAYHDEIEHPYLNWFLKKKKAQNNAQDIVADQLISDKKGKKSKELFSIASGFHMQFVPVFEYDGFEDVVTKLKISFINQSPENITLTYDCQSKFSSFFSTKTTVYAYSSYFLHEIPYELMHDTPKFEWSVTPEQQRKPMTLSDILKIKPKKLYELLGHLQLQADPSFSILLATYNNGDNDEWTEETTQKAQNLNFKVSETQQKDEKKYGLSNSAHEIDLHIENLVEDTADMDNYEMLNIQLGAFENALNNAIELELPHLTVIHGVGKGKLKDAIHELLREKYNIQHFVHDWMPKYGMGATQIFL